MILLVTGYWLLVICYLTIVHDVTLFEYDALIAGKAVEEVGAGVCAIPAHNFRWLKARCLSMKRHGSG